MLVDIFGEQCLIVYAPWSLKVEDVTYTVCKNTGSRACKSIRSWVIPISRLYHPMGKMSQYYLSERDCGLKTVEFYFHGRLQSMLKGVLCVPKGDEERLDHSYQ
jgi:hypothetical protein